VTEELAHFAGDDWRGDLTPEVAYHLMRVLEQYPDNPAVTSLLPKVRGAIAGAGASA
jgi:hypothetical protein